MTILEVLSSISTPIVVGIGVFLHQKMKNLADKSDLASLTQEVEQIKHVYNKDLEITKAILSAQNQLRTAFFAKKLDAIDTIDKLLIQLILYCYQEMTKYTDNEHYPEYKFVTPHDSSSELTILNITTFYEELNRLILINNLYLNGDIKGKVKLFASKQMSLFSAMERTMAERTVTDSQKLKEYENIVENAICLREELNLELHIQKDMRLQ